MKSIHLIRHAKSSWEYSNLSDQKRPISRRGVKDTAIMADALFASGFEFPNVSCSSATRAMLTIQGIAEYWQGSQFEWQITEHLYVFSSDQIWNWVRHLDEASAAVTLIGHNPAFTDFINEACGAISGETIENFPTCAYAEIVFSVDLWSEIDNSQAALKNFLKPKMFKKEFTSL